MQEGDPKPLLLNESIKENNDSQINASIRDQKKTPNAGASHAANSSVVDDGELSPSQKKRKRRYTILQVCSIVGLLIAIVVAFAIPPLIQKAIVEQATEKAILASDNEGLWAHYPGDTGTIITRNFTFFKFDNQGGFLFQHQKPIFREISGYKVQQLQDFLNIQYLDDGNLVKVKDWLRFGELEESKNIDDPVSILNMGNLGYWSTLKTARPTLLLQQGLALLFTNLQNSTIPTLLGSGLNQQFITNISTLYSSLLSPAGISKDNNQFMWSDPVYGFSDKENLGFWATAAINCFENQKKNFIFSNETIILKNYFALSDSQTQSLMYKVYSYVTSLRKLLLENHYCVGIKMSQCTGRYLGVAQLAEGWVTSNTPPVSTISPNDTICDDNVTCKGLYPQPYAFANNIFKIDSNLAKSVNLDPSAPVTFPRQLILNWFNYNHSIQAGLTYNTAQNCLLHIGNLDALWKMGEQYQRNFDPVLLEPIRMRFGLQSASQTLIFWLWIRYITKQFVLQRGNNANVGMANLFTSGFYEHFSYLQDNLQRFLLGKMLVKETSMIECHDLFERILDQKGNTELTNKLCKEFKDTHSQAFALMLVDVCQRKYREQWQKLSSLGVGLLSMQNLCDPQGNDNIGNRLHTYKLELDSHYGCSVTPNPYCSNFELALLQWQNSTVTLSPPDSLPQLQATTSFSNWNMQAKAIEYEYFIQKYILADQKDKFPRYSLQQLFKKFTFEQWFSTNLFVKRFGEKESINPYFMKYIRYVCIYITLKGISATQTPRKFLFGYEDQYIKTVKESYPPFGGDPSAPSVIAFNELNLTEAETTQTVIFKTGKGNSAETYQYYEINGYKYLVNNYTSFNGNTTIWQWKTPWAENDYFYGTPGKIFAPNQFQVNNISLLIPNVQRYGYNFFKNETVMTERYGMELYLGQLNARIGVVGPETQKYYQSMVNVFNVSSLYGLPLFVTKNHFLNSTEWLEKVDIYNEDRSIHYQDISSWDQTFVLLEPYTGVAFQSFIYLQTNYYHQPDPLYDYPTNVLLPIFSVARSGNLTQTKFHDLYDPLLTGFKVKSAALYVGIALMVIFVGLIAFSTWKKRKIGKEVNVNKGSQLGISLQQQHLLSQNYAEVTEEMVKVDQQQ